VATKFEKSRSNRRTESEGLSLLLADARFQVLSTPAKRKVIELLLEKGAFGIQTFDVVMSPSPVEPIDDSNIERLLPSLTLVEMKTTRKPIKDGSLNGFFFGATEREYDMARALGSRYAFAFVVLNKDNVYGRPFAVLLSLEQVEERTRAKRTQFQVNFRSDMSDQQQARGLFLLGTDEDL
jgi:hypothetical protein